MKHVYFLRHGQTDFNKGFIHQFSHTPLSERGKEQAKAIAEVLKEMEFDVIISSPYERTRQTAEYVAKASGKPVEYNDLFVELRRPSILWGRKWLSLKSLWIMARIYFNAAKPLWHHSDEENLEEFHVRAKQALEYLADRKEERILVVTHRGFMANLMSRIKHDGMDTVAQYRRALWKNLEIGNCSFISTTWTPEGEYGETLEGTWSIEGSTTCPPIVNT